MTICLEDVIYPSRSHSIWL